MLPKKICIYSQCQINMTLQILRLLNFNMLTGILKDMEKEKILTTFKLEVHIQRTYYVASNWIWFVLTLNLLEIFRWEKNPDKNNLIRIRVCRWQIFKHPYIWHICHSNLAIFVFKFLRHTCICIRKSHEFTIYTCFRAIYRVKHVVDLYPELCRKCHEEIWNCWIFKTLSTTTGFFSNVNI